jgi:hypothetical protein
LTSICPSQSEPDQLAALSEGFAHREPGLGKEVGAAHAPNGRDHDFGDEMGVIAGELAATDPILNDLAEQLHSFSLMLRKEAPGGLKAVDILAEASARGSGGRDARFK